MAREGTPYGLVMVPSAGDILHPKEVEGLAAWVVGDEVGLLWGEEKMVGSILWDRILRKGL